jgi:peptide/nickel transport system ATP-binding protein
MKKRLLEIKGLSIFKDQDPLIFDSDFCVDGGEVVGLFGESGSGKSVFSLFLMGLLDRSVFRCSASLSVFNFPSLTFDISSRDSVGWDSVRKNNVSMVFQDPTTTLNPTMSCGRQVEEACFFVPVGDRFKYCLDLFSEVGLLDCEKIYFSFPHELSGGQRQRVVIAIALASKPKLLVADEPTTSLDPSTQRSVLDLVLGLKKTRSFGVVLISHNLDLIKFYCDRVYVFNNSKLLSLLSPPARSRVDLLEGVLLNIKNRNYSGFSPEPFGFYKKPDISLGGAVFSLKNVSLSFPNKGGLFFALNSISLSLFWGECLGVVGCSGSGKTTLGRIFCGLEKKYSGSFVFPETNSFFKKSVQMVYQDPFSSFNPKYTIGDSLSEIINLYKSNYSVSDLFRLVSLDPDLSERFPFQLSGGQKQRASIARVLASNPRVVVFDEPLSALDIETQISILELIRFINSVLRITVVFISHDINSVYYLCNRIVVLNKGRVVECFNGDELYLKSRTSYVKKLISDSNFI